MYFDVRPCATCGGEVDLEPRDTPAAVDRRDSADHPPDAVVDERVCTNPDCPSHRGEGEV
jgi:hypothetical protein